MQMILAESEIMLGVDDDDKESIDWVNNEAADFVNPLVVHVRQKYSDLGYEQLNIYVNLLCHASTGAWLFLWNDDALMQTKGWDTVVRSYDGQFKCLASKIIVIIHLLYFPYSQIGLCYVMLGVLMHKMILG